MGFLWEAILVWGLGADASSLIADYLAFDRQRTWRRQYLKAFGGMAILVLLGALFDRVPGGEALAAAGLLLVLPLLLAVVEAFRWRRLVRRLKELPYSDTKDQQVVKKS